MTDDELKANREDWEALARLDPLWAISSHPQHKHGRWSTESFFEIGRTLAGDVLDRFDDLQRPSGRRRALDFGCGVGRVTRWFTGVFSECVGIDISPSMIDLARRYNAEYDSIEWIVSADPEIPACPDQSFDLVYSRIVLQHVATPALAMRYIASLYRLTAPDGLLVFQLPAGISWRHRLALKSRLHRLARAVGISDDWLYRRLGLHPMSMLSIPEDGVRDLIRSLGGRDLAIDRFIEGPIDNRTYWVTRPGGGDT